MKNALFATGLLLALAACAPKATETAAPAPTGLAGTQWRLTAIEPASTAAPSPRPEDSAKYTLAFGADGRVSAQLDCNRGNGSWTSAGPGQLQFGPIATTRMFCPQPSLGDALGRQLGEVRGYSVQGDSLRLSLQGTGGTLVWVRTTP